MKAIIDADVLIYRVGFTTEDVDEHIAFWRLDNMIKEILKALGTSDYHCYLTSHDHSCFRYEIDRDYKANRTKPKPLHYTALRTHLLENHPTDIISGMEADDALGINQSSETILVSIDKDLRQIPGQHYHFVNKELYEIDPVGGKRWFYKQILIGDSSDGIEGLRGIGPVKADRFLDGFDDESDMCRRVLQLYEEKYSAEEARARVLKAGQLLKIRQSEDEPIWQLPDIKEKTDIDLD
jgi:DNA polymerase I